MGRSQGGPRSVGAGTKWKSGASKFFWFEFLSGLKWPRSGRGGEAGDQREVRERGEPGVGAEGLSVPGIGGVGDSLPQHPDTGVAAGGRDARADGTGGGEVSGRGAKRLSAVGWREVADGRRRGEDAAACRGFSGGKFCGVCIEASGGETFSFNIDMGGAFANCSPTPSSGTLHQKKFPTTPPSQNASGMRPTLSPPDTWH